MKPHAASGSRKPRPIGALIPFEPWSNATHNAKLQVKLDKWINEDQSRSGLVLAGFDRDDPGRPFRAIEQAAGRGRGEDAQRRQEGGRPVRVAEGRLQRRREEGRRILRGPVRRQLEDDRVQAIRGRGRVRAAGRQGRHGEGVAGEQRVQVRAVGHLCVKAPGRRVQVP